MTTDAVQRLTNDFIAALDAYVIDRLNDRIGAALRIAEITPPRVRNEFVDTVKRPRKKMPIQYCPAPGCRERAAPAFAMLCRRHKDTPKKLVAKYRAARRERKEKARS